MEITLLVLSVLVMLNQFFRIKDLKNELKITKENLLAVLHEDKREYFVYKDSEISE